MFFAVWAAVMVVATTVVSLGVAAGAAQEGFGIAATLPGILLGFALSIGVTVALPLALVRSGARATFEELRTALEAPGPYGQFSPEKLVKRSATAPLRRLITGSAAVLAITAGVLLLAFGLHLQWRIEAVERWPSTPGRVVASDVAVIGPSIYWPAVAYEYDIAGRRYRGDSIDVNPLARQTAIVLGRPRSGGNLGPDAEARARAARYPVGATVAVRYDPADPSTGVLLEAGRYRPWDYARVGLLLFAIGSVLALVWGTWRLPARRAARGPVVEQ